MPLAPRGTSLPRPCPGHCHPRASRCGPAPLFPLQPQPRQAWILGMLALPLPLPTPLQGSPHVLLGPDQAGGLGSSVGSSHGHSRAPGVTLGQSWSPHHLEHPPWPGAETSGSWTHSAPTHVGQGQGHAVRTPCLGHRAAGGQNTRRAKDVQAPHTRGPRTQSSRGGLGYSG